MMLIVSFLIGVDVELKVGHDITLSVHVNTSLHRFPSPPFLLLLPEPLPVGEALCRGGRSLRGGRGGGAEGVLSVLSSDSVQGLLCLPLLLPLHLLSLPLPLLLLLLLPPLLLLLLQHLHLLLLVLRLLLEGCEAVR